MSNAKERLAKILAARRSTVSGEQDANDSSTEVGYKSGTQVHGQESKGLSLSVHKEESSLRGNSTQGSSTNPVPSKPSVVTLQHPLALKLQELEQALEQKLPNMPYILRDIHSTMAKDFEVVTMLSDEEIGLFVRGLREHTGITIQANPKKAQKGRSQPIDLSMLD